MWALDNRTPYSAGRNWTRDGQGVHLWIVAVKATFVFERAGRLRLADEQDPPVLMPEYFGKAGQSSLRYDSDLLARKPGTDVLVDAHAYAPGGLPAHAVPVALRAGALHKELRVYGDRLYRDDGSSLTAPQPFDKRAIRYEWAFGGFDQADPDGSKHRMDGRNPVGKGFSTRPSHLAHRPAPAIEYPTGDVRTAGPAGFGPLDAAWSPRRELAGTYDQRWEATKKPLLPDDYDERFALAAPPDQQSPTPLRGGEHFELQNMTPDGVLRFELPRIDLAFATRFGSRREEHEGRLVTVIVEPEVSRVLLVWQTALAVRMRDVDYLDKTVIEERTGVR
jgi:hypothetical protein